MPTDTSNFSFQGVGIVNSYSIDGCIDPLACNFDPLATIDDGSCLTVYGCTNPLASNYEPLAECDDGSCLCVGNYGCMNSTACNYDPTATCNCDAQAVLDGSCNATDQCILPDGCTDPTAINYDPAALCDDLSCIGTFYGCMDPVACNYDANANVEDGSCEYYGCMDQSFLEYDPLATCPDPSMCLTLIVSGCTDPNMFGYNPWANVDDGSCVPIVTGCTDPAASNYNSNANTNDNSCVYPGCTDPTAANYDPVATVDDGSCVAVSVNTYFVFWSDTTQSMENTVYNTSKMASVPTVRIKGVTINFTNYMSVQENFFSGPQFTYPAGKVDNPSGLTSKAYLCLQVGMEVEGDYIVPGTTITSITGGTYLTLSNQPTASLPGTPQSVYTFSLTSQQKEIDYNDTTNFRNLLQDHYATAGTLASGNTNPATNGTDMYDSHMWWCHSHYENPINYLASHHSGTPPTIGSGGYFPDAEKIVVLAFADEARPHYNNWWNYRASMTNAAIITHVNFVKNFITDLETAAGNTNIYRGIFFRVYNAGGNVLEQIMGDNGLMETGGRTANGFAYPPEAAAYDITTETLYPESSGSPTRILWKGNVIRGQSAAYYYDIVKTQLNRDDIDGFDFQL